MVTPAAERKAVAHLVEHHAMSERRACKATGCCRMTVRYTSTRPDDELLRERMIAIARERRRFGYLQRAAETLAIDAWRRESRHAAVIDPLAMADDAIADPGPAADAMMMAREENLALAAAIEALPPRCREVLLLHRFEGLSYAQIAKRLGISRNTVMVHLAKAMASLRRQMRENSAATG